MLNFEHHFILDSKKTWSPRITDIIHTYQCDLNNYLMLDQRIEKLAEKDFGLKIHRPDNPYESRFIDVCYKIEKILTELKIIGFHCTRLTDNEIMDILDYGLKPLSKELINQKINKLLENGLINEGFRNKLLDNNSCSDNNRAGLIHFFHYKKELQDVLGLHRLLRSWGGEALYRHHESDEQIRKIGTPCIVIASIEVCQLDPIPRLSERMIRLFISRRFDIGDFTTHLTTNTKVLRIINKNEKLFSELTKYKNWRYSID